MTFSAEQNEKLNKKLDPANVKPPKKFGPKGHYIEGWHAIAEANRIFGFDGWSYEVVKTDCVSQSERKVGAKQRDGWGVTYIATVRTSIHETTREDVGGGHGYDVDLGLAHESAIKEAVTDALKRALRTYGNPFGLALYDKEQNNVGADFNWAEERDDLTRLLSNCENLKAVLDLWRTERMQNFIKKAPPEYSSPVIKIKDIRKAQETKSEAA